jgi:oligoribonuclease (3'-5' exoribonuclease)
MPKMVILDIETTGLDPIKNSMIELGAVITDENLTSITDMVTYVKLRENTVINKSAMEVNQINLNSQAYGLFAIDPRIAVFGFNSWVLSNCEGGKPFVAGWNPSFDVSFMRSYYKEYGLEWPFHYRMLDVQSINAFVDNFNFTSLKSVRAAQKHRALDDAFDVLSRLKELRSMISNKYPNKGDCLG